MKREEVGTYDIGPKRALLDRLKEETGGFTVILLDEAAVGQDRGEMVGKDAPVEGN